MTDFCDFTPEDSSCNTQHPVLTTGHEGEHGHEGDHGHHDDYGHDGGNYDSMDKMDRMDGKMTWEEVDEQLEEWNFARSGFTTPIMTNMMLAAGAFL